MKVGELRKALEGVPDDFDVVVRAWNDEGADYCGTITSAGEELDCDCDSFFAIDCGPDEEDG